MLSSFDLNGQVAMVTGAGRGIGQAVSLALARAGATVVAVDLNGEAAAETAHAVEMLGRQSLSLAVDVSDETQVDEAFARVAERFGRLDILVNNAAVFGQSHLDVMPTSEWRRVLSVDLDGVFFCCRAAIRLMKPRRYGRIVNLSSIAGQAFSAASGAAYSTAKAGVLGLTRHAAIEAAQHGINVNAVLPGFVRTPQVDQRMSADMKARLAAIAPVDRLLEPEELAAVILFLASPAASAVAGHGLVADGGVTITASWYDREQYRYEPSSGGR